MGDGKFWEVSRRPFIIPVFLPQAGCPHRCVFCNQRAVTRENRPVPSPGQLRFIIHSFLQFPAAARKNIQVAFYGGNFLGLEKNKLEALLGEAAGFVRAGHVDSIRFSTRPDTITAGRLERLRDYPVSTIELGAQSMDDRVLNISGRCHTASDTVAAVHLLKKENYQVGLQMMVGLPGDDEATALRTGRQIADLSPDFVRIYPTVVLENSRLGQWYKQGRYVPIPLEKCVTMVKKLYLIFQGEKIPVIRMGLQSTGGDENQTAILAGPYHPAFGHMVHSEIFLDMAVSSLTAGSFFQDTVVIKVHPRSISKMRGLKNRNIEILKDKFHIRTLTVLSDPSMPIDQLRIAG
ncbi:MAG: radical SAM protein [Desulfobacterales bacterium]|nr:radical SAM protein [Desulfobacterales bacterium]